MPTDYLRRCCRHAIHRHEARTGWRVPPEDTLIQCGDCLRCLRWMIGAWTPVPDTEAPAWADTARRERAKALLQSPWGAKEKP